MVPYLFHYFTPSEMPLSSSPPRRDPFVSSIQKLVFASGAVATASTLGRVFGRLLPAKETIQCSPSNCSQQHIALSQAQSPSHAYHQQCPIHKRFRLFRQRPRRCPVHGSSSSAPNYILSPTTIHPFVVLPEKILPDPHEDVLVRGPNSNNATIPQSPSTSSRLSSYSTVSLAMSLSSFTLGSDSEGGSSSSGWSSKRKKKKKQSKDQQPSRCLCYLDPSLDQQSPDQRPDPYTSLTWYPKTHQKESSRLKRIWNDSGIFHRSKSPAISSATMPAPSSRRWISQHRAESHGYDVQSTSATAPHLSASNVHLDRPGMAIRTSLSGTDISDEGNHTLTDVEDDDDHSSYQAAASSANTARVSFQDHTAAAHRRTTNLRDDLRKISRHQAELNQQGGGGVSSAQEPHLRSSQPPQIPKRTHSLRQGNAETSQFADGSKMVEGEEEEEDEDWDIQSDSGAPSSSPMYSAGAREPASYSTVNLPLTPPGSMFSNHRAHLKRPSNSNIGSGGRGSRQRCLSLPSDTKHPGLLKIPSGPSENWDEDFDIDSAGINVPSQVTETQDALQENIFFIRDFALHIKYLKVIRASLRVASTSLKAKNPKKHYDLSKMFQRDWEQAEVIIDLGEIAQTSTDAGPSSTSSPSTTTSPTTTTPPRSFPAQPSSPSSPTRDGPVAPIPLSHKTRTESTSSTLTGSTLVASPRSDVFLDGVQKEDLEDYSPSSGRKSNSGVKISNSSPAGFGLCTSAMSVENGLDPGPSSPKMHHHPHHHNHHHQHHHHQYSHAASEKRRKHQSLPVPKSNSVMPLHGDPTLDIDASFHRYQRHHPRHAKELPVQHETRGSVEGKAKGRDHRHRHLNENGNDENEEDEEEEEEEEEDDDGYESFGYNDGPVGVITPIPSDRHMQVLKDILMEGLGKDVARQYMFKCGEQDHVRFTVEVIPGLLDHLKILQQRLVDQLQQIAVLVKEVLEDEEDGE
ncbi:hypothetical protein BGW38_005389, partial [Lunasporangiospora selenospora]